ncbi:MAG: serine/threonine-protein phosphatase, partial [Leptospiraceae bacterium]|nr:serine/threonine-protein phosphatase [Leptospiraceae bacterium]
MKKSPEKISYLENIIVKNIWFSLIFIIFLIFLFATSIIDLDTFAISFSCVIAFEIGFYALNLTILQQVERYREIADFLNISRNSNFEIKNKFAQELIFPPDMNNNCFEVVSINRPLTYLGGDLHFQLIDYDGHYWFAIGDASGHDINSHLFSVMILTQLSYYINHSDTPKEVNQKINEKLKERISRNNDPLPCYASLAVMKSDRDGKFIHYGQHPNMVLYRKKEDKTEVIETSGDFIGTSTYPLPISSLDEPKEFQMESGDILFTFTDGIFEQQNSKGKYYGYRLYEFINDQPKDDLKKFSENLYKDVYNFTENLITDDMTLMIIR